MAEDQKDTAYSKTVAGWLSEFSNPLTRAAYERRINEFFQDTGLTEEKLRELDADQIKTEILNYRRKALEHGDRQNTVLSVICAVRSYLAQINKSIKFRRNTLGKVEADNDSHVFTNGDLKQLFTIGNPMEKAIIATASSLGWEVSAFLALEKDKVSRLIAHAKANDEKFIFFEDTRGKTGESRLAIFNPLAIEWLSKYLETRKDDNPQLFPLTKDGIVKMMNRLAKNSGLKTTGPVRFHNIRKWLMSRLSRAGFNEFQIKYVLGKAIGVSDRTYLQTLKNEIEEKIPRVYADYLDINFSPASAVMSKESQKKLGDLEGEVKTLRTQTEAMTSRIESLEKDKILNQFDLKDFLQYVNDKEGTKYTLPEFKLKHGMYLSKTEREELIREGKMEEEPEEDKLEDKQD